MKQATSPRQYLASRKWLGREIEHAIEKAEEHIHGHRLDVFVLTWLISATELPPNKQDELSRRLEGTRS